VKRIDCIFFDAGGGHRSAALALEKILEQNRHPWQLRLVNLQEVLDPVDLVRRMAGMRIQDVYNLMLRNEWTLGSPQLLRVLQAAIAFYAEDSVRLFSEMWKSNPPDMVISVIPHFNRILYQALSEAACGVPYLTILTDFADYPPHFWIEKQDQYFICGTERAVGQAREAGIAESRIFQTSGMILHPRFYEPLAMDRETERERLGLHPSLPTGLLLFGSEGSKSMAEILTHLEESRLEIQLIMLCGRNAKLQRDLARFRSRLRLHLQGYTREVPYFMHLSDFFMGKPGPGSISEALAMGLPVIVESNVKTLPQERYNAQWVEEQGVGIRLSSFHEISRAVSTLLEPAHLARYRSRVAALNNRAVFEIPHMIESILERPSARLAVGA